MEQQFRDGQPQPVSPRIVMRRVTRGYVRLLAAVTATLAVALVIAAWGLSTYLLELELVGAHASVLTLPGALLLCVVLAVPCWWQQALRLLRGMPALARGWLALGVFAAMLIVGGGRMLAHSEFFAAWNLLTLQVGLAFAVAHLFFWIVLSRQVYTLKGRPLWPWEAQDERVREVQQLRQMWERS